MFSLREKIVQTDTILPSNNIFDSEIIHLVNKFHILVSNSNEFSWNLSVVKEL